MAAKNIFHMFQNCQLEMYSPLEVEEEVGVDKQSELTSFLLLIGTTTPSSEYIEEHKGKYSYSVDT